VNVLLVDDDRVLLQRLATFLRSKTLDVLIAFDGMQATMMATKSAPAAIALDVGLPGGTGMEVLRRLKTSTKTAGIPVLVMSGSTDPGIPQRALELGAAAFIPKPFEMEVFYGQISKLLDTSQ
jgi:DNA-binding response OmpR family regulator